jgi:hypothetical protein
MNDRFDPLIDLLADHDAGLPVDPAALADPRAQTVLDAIAAVRADLAAVPPVPVPPEFAAAWTAALTTPTPPARVDQSDTPRSPIGHRAAPALRPTPAPRGSPGPGRTRCQRSMRPTVIAGLVLVVVLVAVGVIGVGVVGVRRDPPSVTAAQIGGIARAAVGLRDAGPFTDPARRAACLRTVAPPGLSPDAPLAGGRSVVFDGRPGVLLLLITGRLAVFRVVVVTPRCDALLADTVIGP